MQSTHFIAGYDLCIIMYVTNKAHLSLILFFFKTNISIDVNLVTSTLCFMGSVPGSG